MVADKKRTLRPGHEYHALIPPASNTLAGQRRWKGSHDSVDGVREYATRFTHQTKALAEKLRGSTPRQTAENVWNFIYRHIQYKNDAPGFEQIRSPSRSWHERITGVDCDDYSIIASSILLNLGIPHFLRMTDYGQGKGWQHIYVIVPNSGKLTPSLDQSDRTAYLVIDAVTDQFNHEVRYAKKEDFKMEIQFLQGLDGVTDLGEAMTDALGKTIVGRGFARLAKNARAGVTDIRKAATTPIRLGILAWVKLDVRNAGSQLRFGYVPYNTGVARSGYGPNAHARIVDSLRKLHNQFIGLGGDGNALREAILNGAGNRDNAVVSTTPNLSGNADYQAINGLGAVEPVTITLITAATTVMVPILEMLGRAKANDPADPIPDQTYCEIYPGECAEEGSADPADDDLGEIGALRRKLKKGVKAAVARRKTAPRPVVARPVVARPVVARPVVARPVVARPVVAQPITSRPIVAQPITSRPIVARPVLSAALPVSSVVPVRPTAAAIIEKRKPGLLRRVSGALKADADKKAARALKRETRQTVRSNRGNPQLVTPPFATPLPATPPIVSTASQPLRTMPPVAPVAPVAPLRVVARNDDFEPAEITVARPVVTQPADAERPRIQQIAQRASEVLNRTSAVVAVANRAAADYKAAISPPSNEEGTEDFTAVTEAQANSTAVPQLPALPARTGGFNLDFFNGEDGKPSLLKIGGTAIGLLVVSKLLFGAGSGGGSGYQRRRRGLLSGTPKTSKKERSQSGKRAKTGGGLAAVALS